MPLKLQNETTGIIKDNQNVFNRKSVTNKQNSHLYLNVL